MGRSRLASSIGVLVAVGGAFMVACQGGASPNWRGGSLGPADDVSTAASEVGGSQTRVYEVAQSGRLDVSVLLAIPSAVPRDLAPEILITVGADRIAKTFQADAFGGRQGAYVGFAPGFDASVLGRARFLKRSNVLIPYASIDSHFIPLATSTEGASQTFFYPVLVDQGGALVPTYLAAPPPLLATYGIVYPVAISGTYLSPLDIGRVPAAALDRPYVNLKTPSTTSVSTGGGGTVTSTTSTTGDVGALTGTTGTTTTTGRATTTGTGHTTTTGTGRTTTTSTGRVHTTTSTGPAATTTTGPDTTSTTTIGPAVSSSVSTGPASITTTSSTALGLPVRE